MKLSILTTITNPKKRQDRFIEALTCFYDVADEIVIVDGGEETNWCPFPMKDKIKWIFKEWPYDFDWVEFPRHLNAGLEQCTGDWVLRIDIDQLLYEGMRAELDNLLTIARDYPIATLSKFTVVTPTGMFQKGQIPVLINRKFKDICFGYCMDRDTDMCVPIQKKGVKMYNGYALPFGNILYNQFHTKIRLYNYDYFFKTKEFALQEYERFGNAYHKFFKTKPFGEKSFNQLRLNYLKKITYKIKLEDHPKYIRDAVKDVMDEKLQVVGNMYRINK